MVVVDEYSDKTLGDGGFMFPLFACYSDSTAETKGSLAEYFESITEMHQVSHHHADALW